MKRLTLIRHAKSSWGEPMSTDFDRELNERGEKNAPEMGRRLKALGFNPGAMVSSPARRALRTAKAVSKEIGFTPGGLRTDRRIYEASVGDLAAVGRELEDVWDHVILVGHNPGFTDFANWIADCGIQNIPTCGVVDIECDISSWRELGAGSGRLLDFDFPKKN